jgi:DNA-binding transcriptional MerR regulator
LAKRTGLTVRALHHYDAIGLLSPSGRTPAGHRRYTEHDALRLQHIVSLRSLGFPLARIAELLDAKGWSLAEVLALQLEATRARLRETQALCERLEAMTRQLAARSAPSLDDVLTTIEATTMQRPFATEASVQAFFTPEQVAALKARASAQTLPPERALQHWKTMFERLTALHARGLDPAAPEVQAVVATCRGLLTDITGGDAGLEQGLASMFHADPAGAASLLGVEPQVFTFLGRARRVTGERAS